MKIVITGGCGFLGCNLAEHFAREGHDVWVFDNLSRRGSRENWEFLSAQDGIRPIVADIRDFQVVTDTISRVTPDVVLHMCGQVAMTTSLADPRADFEINCMGGHNVLETVRRCAPDAALLFSSTNKVYGDLEQICIEETPTRFIAPDFPHGFDENLPLHFQSPYGCSKGAIDQYMLDYARIFGLKTVVFRHSSIFGAHQFSTFDQGWVGWFVSQALEQKRGKAAPFTIAGNGKQVRDLLFVSDLVACYQMALQNIETAAGQAFNIGGGMKNSLSLLELFAFLEEKLEIQLRFEPLAPRQSDQRVFVADTRKAQELLGWEPRVSKESGLQRMIEWMDGDE